MQHTSNGRVINLCRVNFGVYQAAESSGKGFLQSLNLPMLCVELELALS